MPKLSVTSPLAAATMNIQNPTVGTDETEMHYLTHTPSATDYSNNINTSGTIGIWNTNKHSQLTSRTLSECGGCRLARANMYRSWCSCMVFVEKIHSSYSSIWTLYLYQWDAKGIHPIHDFELKMTRNQRWIKECRQAKNSKCEETFWMVQYFERTALNVYGLSFMIVDGSQCMFVRKTVFLVQKMRLCSIFSYVKQRLNVLPKNSSKHSATQ